MFSHLYCDIAINNTKVGKKQNKKTNRSIFEDKIEEKNPVKVAKD